MKVEFKINGRWVDSEEKNIRSGRDRRKSPDRRKTPDRRVGDRRTECRS